MLILAIEAATLLLLGLSCGNFVTMVDILLVGTPAFIEHVTLWTFLNVLLATHVENKGRAMAWSVPLNLGYIASYYIATSATYEGYPRSLVVPLCAMAFIAPLLVYGLWYVKNDQGIYGKLLGLLTGAATVGMSYLILGEVSVYAGVMGALTFLFLSVIPTRKIKVAATDHPTLELLETDGLAEDLRRLEIEKNAKGARRTPQKRSVSREDYDEIGPLERPVSATELLDTGARELERESRTHRPTRRKATGARRSSARSRRSQMRELEREREERRLAANERRARAAAQDEAASDRISTLGNTRMPSRSRRNY